jgi:hypothetical protein
MQTAQWDENWETATQTAKVGWKLGNYDAKLQK